VAGVPGGGLAGPASRAGRPGCGRRPAFERVKAALVDRDEALHKAREDLAGARTVAAEWEAEVASTRAQLHKTVRPSRGHRPGRVRPRRRPRRPRG
jgi:hypothetical protein